VCLITFDKFLTNIKLFHVYIKVHNTTSDIGHKPAISNRLPKIKIDWLIKVLRNGCFHNGLVICPRLVIMAQGRLYWPKAIFEVIKILKYFKFYEIFERVVSLLRHAMGCLPGNNRVVTP
jgi:hypothetical protein